MELYLDGERLRQVAEQHRAAYARAEPFPHVVLDRLFPDEALERVLQEFPPPASEVWKEYDNEFEEKLETQGEAHVGPDTSLLLYQFNSAPFLEFLERLTGIENLLPDPYFVGGGLHQIMRGGRLGVHADFSGHKKLPLERRLNVLIYLNHDWPEEYGGSLELWSRDRERCVERILPVFNRTVVFTITDWAFHGHPEPLTCPPDRTRKSIALYYFTVGRPPGEVEQGRHGTLFLSGAGGPAVAASPGIAVRARATLARLLPDTLVERRHAARRRRDATRRSGGPEGRPPA